jgi:hypothetical protein
VTRKHTPRIGVRLHFIGALLAVFMFVGTVHSEEHITAKTHSPPMAKLTDQEWQVVSFAAARVVRHTAQAIQALNDKKNEDALVHIEKGLILLSIIHNVVPHPKVTAEIRSGDIVYRDEYEVSQMLVPIFDELAEIDIVNPALRAKPVGRTTPPRDDKKRTQASSLTRFAKGDEQPALKLNTVLARYWFESAKRNMENDKIHVAESDLRRIQVDGVISGVEETDLLLERTADYLQYAQAALKLNQNDETKAALKSASDALKAYEKLTEGSRTQVVRDLHHEIDQLAGTLNASTSKTDQQKAISAISGWWVHVVKWLETTSSVISVGRSYSTRAETNRR